MDYRTLAEQLIELRTSLHLTPFSQELATLERGIFFALNFLMLHKNSAYPKDLSRGMGVSSARVAALLNHLEKEGLIRRSPDPKDSRQVIVSLTDSGVRAIRQKREEVLDIAAQTLEELGPEDAEALLRIQKKLAEKFLIRAKTAVPSNADRLKGGGDFTA